MVPSRSRKTAGRNGALSARSHLRGAQPTARGSLDGFGDHAGHTAMIGGAAAQKTGAAIGLFLNHGASRSDGSGPIRVGWAENGHHRKADCGGDMHGPGIVADKKLAARKERG